MQKLKMSSWANSVKRISWQITSSGLLELTMTFLEAFVIQSREKRQPLTKTTWMSLFIISESKINPVFGQNISLKPVYFFRMLQLFTALNTSYPGNDNCFQDADTITFWMGIRRNDVTNTWYNPFDSTMDFSYFELEVASESENCAYIQGGKISPASCDGRSPCGICKIPEKKVLYLKGLCEDDNDWYDNQYYIHGSQNDRPFFQ